MGFGRNREERDVGPRPVTPVESGLYAYFEEVARITISVSLDHAGFCQFRQ